MIRSALGASPLERNAKALAAILSSRRSGVVGVQAAEWAAQAFRRAGADEVRVERFGGSGASANVIAEVRGRQSPRDYVLVVATLDSSGPDSLLTAEKAAVLIDAVRVIHDTGNVPRRSIRFVLWGSGTDRGGRFAGAWAYIRARRAGLDRIAAALALFPAGGAIGGFSLEARPDTLDAVRRALEPLHALGIRHFSQEVKVLGAVTPLWLEGIPTLVATANSAPQPAALRASDRAKSPAEGLSVARLHELKRRVAAGAVAAYALADAEARVGFRQSPVQVRQSIESLGLANSLKQAGLWSQWQSASGQSR